jgi:hypothetical protein
MELRSGFCGQWFRDRESGVQRSPYVELFNSSSVHRHFSPVFLCRFNQDRFIPNRNKAGGQTATTSLSLITNTPLCGQVAFSDATASCVNELFRFARTPLRARGPKDTRRLTADVGTVTALRDCQIAARNPERVRLKRESSSWRFEQIR